MDRRSFFATLLASAAAPVLVRGQGRVQRALEIAAASDGQTASGFPPLRKSKAEWRRLLTRAQYDVLFEEDTERSFSHPLNNEKRKGTYICAACYLPLFDSATKYDSGTGWPSFTAAMAGRVGLKVDYKLIYPRTEYHCVRCTGHQGHVFNDGPRPTGQRWCNNGLALVFVPDGRPLPALRT